eukprot:TRINITY_DN72891_c0_g1_i1.p1 TRINITY_DN72891_c0_g1~~TRINITY_DN72891_c0_g1_i1.p1  ORF type:complete len:220 (+),score=52.61 TRINITY_DN72891_c0_g1_i1:59-718(+)
MAEQSESPVFVTGLPGGSTEESVKTIFAQYGEVASVKVLPPHPQKSDTAAIVVMKSAEQAKWMIDNVSGKVPQGLAGPVEVKPKSERRAGGGAGKGWGKGGAFMNPWMMMQQLYWMKGAGKGKTRGGLSTFPAEKKVWIGDLPEGVTFKELQDHFGGPSKAKFAAVMRGKGAGTGGVAFATAEEATEAIATLNGSTLAGAKIVVDVWTKKSETIENTTV